MTLVAGTPHFDCRCPNGNVKPFCLTFLTGKTGCCCEGSCCSEFPGEEVETFAAHDSPSVIAPKETCCCCKAHQEKAGDESRTASRFGKACCQKSLAVMAVAVLEPSVKVSVQDLTAHLFVPAPEAMMEHDGFGSCDCLSAYHYHWIPPPIDLVTVLQHFLI